MSDPAAGPPVLTACKCGSSNVRAYLVHTGEYWIACCDGCRKRAVAAPTEAEAVDGWNRRALPTYDPATQVVARKDWASRLRDIGFDQNDIEAVAAALDLSIAAAGKP